jgi:hypothetical protein
VGIAHARKNMASNSKLILVFLVLVLIALMVICFMNMMLLARSPHPAHDGSKSASAGSSHTSAHDSKIVHGLRKRVDVLEGRLQEQRNSHDKVVDELIGRVKHLEGQLSKLEQGAFKEGQLSELANPAHIAHVARQNLMWSAGRTTCNRDLGDFSSQNAMLAAGWIFDVSNAEYGAEFLSWKSGDEIGSLRMTLNGSGRLVLHVTTNNFPEKGNTVTAKLGQRWQMNATNDADIITCVRFSHGDMLTITEKYSQIRIKAVKVLCSSGGHVSAHPCVVGNKVQVVGVRCDQSDWIDATLTRILNETRAVVKVDQNGHSQERIVSASEVFLSRTENSNQDVVPSFSELAAGVSPEPQNCGAFEFRRRGIGVVMLADRQFQRTYSPHVRSQRCFASWRAYDFFIFESSDFPVCQRFSKVFFFQKHCIIAEFLKTQAPDYVAIVVDADVLAVVLDRGIEEWLIQEEDIIFYTRGTEIAAGNYIVRNTAWSRAFLLAWADFITRQPAGFSSADNGAIHLHVVESLRRKEAQRCATMYAELTALVDNLKPYFKFVECTRLSLGYPGTWSIDTNHGLAKITVLAEKDNFVADPPKATASNLTGPLMYHGIKNPEAASSYYASFDECRLHKQS